MEDGTQQLKQRGKKNTHLWTYYLVVFFLLLVSNPSVATVSPAIEHRNSLLSQPPLSAPTEVVLIDTFVPDYEYLLDNLGDNAQAFLVDHTKPGLPQLKKILSQFDNISTLHIVSHGFAGGIQIGNSNFDTEFLIQREEELALLSRYIKHNGEVFIYGCNVAGSDEGKVFVDTLSHILGVDVAASDNLTGAAEKGGDWQFEYPAGYLGSNSFLLSGTELGYQYVMPVFAFETATQPTPKSVQETVAGVTMTITDPYANMFALDGSGIAETTGVVAGIPNVDTTQHTFIFDTVVDITSMHLEDQGSANNDVTLTPNVGTSIDVVLTELGVTISPVDWSGVSSIVVTEQLAIDPLDDWLTDILYDDIVFTISSSNSPPNVGTVTANNVTQANAGATSYTFTVAYSDVDSNFDATTIDTADVTVSGGAVVTGASWSGTAVGGTATYTITPPGGTWDEGDNGTYAIAIAANQVGDSAPAYAAADNSAGTIIVSVGTTAADVVVGNNGTAVGFFSCCGLDIGQSFTAAVDGELKNIQVVVGSTAVSGDPVELKIYSGESVAVGDLLHTQTFSGSMAATYTASSDYTFQSLALSPAVSITSGSVYTFHFSSAASSYDFAYSAGNSYVNGQLYADAGGGFSSTFEMVFQVTQTAVASNVAPAAGTVTANDVTQANAGASSYVFTVAYSDADSNFDSTTIGTDDVTVSGGATVTGASWSGTATSGTATYTISPPGGTWDDGDNGTYTIAIVGSQVGDTTPAYVAANASAGSFTVSMDTSAPIISAVTIPDAAMKVGDVVSVTLTVGDDGGDIYTNLSGTVGGFALSGLSRTNSTTYAAQFAVINGGTDVAAGGTIPVSITLDDSTGNTSTSYTTAITQASDSIDANNPGTATGSLAVDEGASNSTVAGTVTASDANSYSLTDDAGGRFAIGFGTGVVTVANGSLLVYLDNTSHNITVQVADAAGNTSSTVLSVAINDVNAAPSITSTAGTSATEDSLYNYTATVTDVDDANNGIDLTWSLTNQPTGMTVSTTGVVSWTPANGVTASGAVTLTVADGGEDGAAAATEIFTIAVTAINNAPSITSTAGTSATEETLYSYTAVVIDADDTNNGIDLTWSLTNQPTGMTVSTTG
ncbi:hypothetical protein MNBD_GAMMA26-483, partial [hydrothermal vent metagenome]